MPPRFPISTVSNRLSSTMAQPRIAFPSGPFNFNRAAAPLVAATATATIAAATTKGPQLGRVAKWYLPAMAALALGITLLPPSLFTEEPTKRTVTLDAATRRIASDITTQLDATNRARNPTPPLTQDQLNQAMLNSYGARDSLADMEKAIAGYEAGMAALMAAPPVDRVHTLEEAYGDRSNLGQVRRAMQMYEVQ